MKECCSKWKFEGIVKLETSGSPYIEGVRSDKLKGCPECLTPFKEEVKLPELPEEISLNELNLSDCPHTYLGEHFNQLIRYLKAREKSIVFSIDEKGKSQENKGVENA